MCEGQPGTKSYIDVPVVVMVSSLSCLCHLSSSHQPTAACRCTLSATTQPRPVTQWSNALSPELRQLLLRQQILIYSPHRMLKLLPSATAWH